MIIDVIENSENGLKEMRRNKKWEEKKFDGCIYD